MRNLGWGLTGYSQVPRARSLACSDAGINHHLYRRGEREVTTWLMTRKLIIQIPCFNEAEQLPLTLADLPRVAEGFDVVEVLVIDDGSTDGTADIARAHGVDHVVRHEVNRGLARAFSTGLAACLERGADVIVSTDADNQYDAAAIPDLTGPVLAGEASMVIGARPIRDHAEFSPVKKLLQRLGSWVVRYASGADVPDAPSGFRAISRTLAMRLYVYNAHTYTLETIIQAGRLNEPIKSVPVAVNPMTRQSRLVKSMLGYVVRSAATIIRIFILYRPLQFFLTLAVLIGAPGLIAFIRFLILFAQGDGDGHMQSLVMGAALLAVAAVTLIGGLLADLIAANRAMLADIRMRLLEARLDQSDDKT